MVKRRIPVEKKELYDFSWRFSLYFVGFFFKALFKEEEPIALPQFMTCRMLFKVTALKYMNEQESWASALLLNSEYI